jgi:hypothetical protein
LENHQKQKKENNKKIIKWKKKELMSPNVSYLVRFSINQNVLCALFSSFSVFFLHSNFCNIMLLFFNQKEEQKKERKMF